MVRSTALVTQHCSAEVEKEKACLREAFSHPTLQEVPALPAATKLPLPWAMQLPLPRLLPAAHHTMKVCFAPLLAAPVLVYPLPVCHPIIAEYWPQHLLAQFHAALPSTIASRRRPHHIQEYFEVQSLFP